MWGMKPIAIGRCGDRGNGENVMTITSAGISRVRQIGFFLIKREKKHRKTLVWGEWVKGEHDRIVHQRICQSEARLVSRRIVSWLRLRWAKAWAPGGLTKI